MDFKYSKEDIERIAEEYPSLVTRKVKAHDKKLYENVSENFTGEKFSEKLFRFMYGSEASVCDMAGCEETVNFLGFTRGYREFCSRSCGAKKESSKENIECAYCEKKMKAYECEEKKYCSHDCYIKHKTQKDESDEQLEKAREACREKYDGMGFGSKKIRKKIQNTMEEKYGDKFYVNVKKRKETKKKKYGDPNYNNRKKRRQTCLEKYNDPHYSNREQAAETRKDSKYEEVCNDQKFISVTPCFSKKEYDGAEGFVKYPFKCNDCDEKFEDYLYSGNVPRCPNCYDGWNHVGSSEEEKTITTFIEKILPVDQEVIENDKKVLNGKELDIYIPAKNIAIEYNGLYWHSETQGGKDRYYHLNKTEECEDQGIQLIHIFGNEWRDKPDVIKRRLRHILGCSNQNSIYARNCTVKEIDREAKSRFLKKYHLQGAGASRIKLGLFHGEFFNSDLVGVMTFGTPSVAQGHKEDKRKQWEMKRFALSKPVVGGTGKLFKHFVRNYDAPRVKTYADRRWSTKMDNVYEKIGFEYIGSSNPNYYYFHKENPILKHRFNFRKDQLDDKLEDFDPNLTEWENMQNHDYDRIWDCGHLKYIWEAD